MMMTSPRPLALCVLLLMLCLVSCDLHKYTDGDTLSVWVNRVGPYNNPQEYYMFHALPYCRSEINRIGQFESLGESLLGYELRKLFLVGFKENVISQSVCEMNFDEKTAKVFKRAIDKQYWFQVFADDLPVWGVIGEKINNGVEDLHYFYAHLHFDISYNGEHIVEVNMTSENAVELKEGLKVPFSYSVQWVETTQPSEQRFEKYLDAQFFEHQIHWFSMLNSLMLVVFLLGLISLVLLKTLKKEYSFNDDDSEEDAIEDSGWKLLHREVYRSPSALVLFSAAVGTGYQLSLTTFFTIVIGTSLKLYLKRGSVLSTFCMLYMLFSFVAGYSSGSYYIRNKGLNWIKTALATATLFPAVLLLISIVINVFAKSYGSLAHIPVTTYILLSGLYVATTVIVLAGTVFGRHWNNSASSGATYRVNLMPRLVPAKPWYLSALANYLICGILPFASIFIELYFVYTALWHYKYYYVFGYLLLSFVVLLLVVSSVSVISTYFVLNNEDHKWQWRAFWTGASVACYVWLYSAYYYLYRTEMSGLLQFVEYFGDVAMITFTLSLLCGSVAFYSSELFVLRIYRGLKSE